jgi:uncharacterized iron-regulated protein
MRSHRTRLLLATLTLAAALCGREAFGDEPLTNLPVGDKARATRTVVPVLDGIVDTAKGDVITPATLAKRLDGARILFIGEEHTDLDVHMVQARVIEELHKAGRKVYIGLEMFPVTEQAYLDNWRDGLYTEEGFVRLSQWYQNWGYHWNFYRDIFMFARANKLRMFAINAPRDVVTAMRMKGIDKLTPEERAYLPPTIDFTGSDEHRRVFKASFEDDDALHAKLTDEQQEGMYRAQCTWDATMGWNAAKALEKYDDPQAIMVVLIGAGHVNYGLGSERQLRVNGFKGRIASLIPVHMADPKGAKLEKVQASYANFVWGVPQQVESEYPSLGVSLAGKLGKQPTKIIQVSKGSPAEKAGLLVGDVLLTVDGDAVDNFGTLRAIQSRWRWGDATQVKLQRGEETRTIEVPFRR